MANNQDARRNCERDEAGRPIHGRDADGKPICNASLRKTKRRPDPGKCQNKELGPTGRCWRHGGHVMGNTPDKGHAKVIDMTSLWTRARFEQELRGANNEKVEKIMGVLFKLATAGGGHFDTCKYWLDQAFGTAKSTHEIILPESQFIEIAFGALYDVLATELQREDIYHRCVARIQEDLDQSVSPISQQSLAPLPPTRSLPQISVG